MRFGLAQIFFLGAIVFSVRQSDFFFLRCLSTTMWVKVDFTFEIIREISGVQPVDEMTFVCLLCFTVSVSPMRDQALSAEELFIL